MATPLLKGPQRRPADEWEARRPTPGTHPAWPRHDPLAGIPPQPALARGIPPVRWPQGDLDWLNRISNAPADPVPVPGPAGTGLIETGQMVLFGGSLVNAAAVPTTVSIRDGQDATGGLIATVTVPASVAPGATSTAAGAISAGAGSAALAAGVSATGFTLSFSAAPSTTGTAVLSNVTGGPYTFNIPSGQTSPYTVVFPNPITATSGTVAPTLTIAGLGTGAGTIELYGQAVATSPGSTNQLSLPRAGVICELGLFITGLGGVVTGALYVAHLWKYPFTPPGE